ncbi:MULTISPECIES: C48 family peptidase [Enterobacterales]|uniref:hypothetical protein n=1 Tax=Enterobacterales TaxID=91347 RepID=UPI000847F41C|nr:MULTISPECIES: hypothetical protein [Enterobacterales]WOO50753.1 hypothetical protein R2S03_06155 [Hafnia alvei]MCT6517562.1 hypothetical protein [Proteus vulgaris]ODQ01867.1 hypothetical protein BGK50_10975 [Shigella sp. FC130]OEI90441.1 hypothetical protein BHE86_10560 [Shigella sp. FC1655]WPF05223.1 hypothetical protein SB028_05005 [Proteus vulgaris]
MSITPIAFIPNQQSIKDNEIKNLFDIFDIQVFNNDSLSLNLEIAKNKINELADSVRNGSSKDLDYLVNIMFHDDIKISLYATNQLYLIYSKLNDSIKEDIKELIKSFYEIKVRDDKEYFKERPLLSAMACGDEIAGQQGSGNNVFISAIDNYLNMKCNDSVLVNSTESVSSHNRYISSSELQSWVSLQSYQCDIGHYETMLKKIENNKKSDELKNYVVLVNNNHWVAVFTYKDSCFLCDSLSSNKNNNDERYKLLTRLKEKGFRTFNIDDNLQKNVPNGCGLFALNYIDNLQNKLNTEKVADLTSTIETVLRNTGKTFLSQSDEEQATFNHDFRKKLIMDTLFCFVKFSNE